MASSRSTSSKRGRKSVSLADEDRRYLSEKLDDARGRGAAGDEASESSLFEVLERFGLNSERVERLREKINEMDVRESIEKAQEYLGEQIESARDYARENPKKVIGGAAGVLVGASLLAMALRRAGGEEKRRAKSSAPKSTGSKKAAATSSKKSSKRR
ncbi:MAG: hypothetical protein ACXW3E_15260 [Thermoanaerobaculia bacterium]